MHNLLTNNIITKRRMLTPMKRSIKMTIRADRGVSCHDAAEKIDKNGIIIFDSVS